MDISTPTVSPLRQRMLDDMRMRKMAEHTQDGYIRAVCKLAAFLGRSPDTATIEELRRLQLHLVDAGTGPVTINATITGLKFFFDITLGRPELLAKMQHVRVPRILPVVLSRAEAARLIAAAPNLKHQAAMSVAYGRVCASVRSSRSRSATSTASAWRCAWSRARAARIATPCSARCCWNGFAPGGACGACPRQDPRRRLALPRPGPDRPADRAPSQPRRPPCR